MKNLFRVRNLLLALLFLPLGSTYAQEKHDSIILTLVYLTSGDVYIGSIEEELNSALILDEVILGRVVIPNADVKKVESILQNTEVSIRLSDNSRYTGTLLDITKDHYAILSPYAGEVNIPKMQVREVIRLEEGLSGYDNPNSTRYFFAPSAIPITRKGGYYQNAYILANSVNFGITDNITIGGGVVIPLLFYITPKVGFEVRKNFYLGAGLLAGTTLIPGAIISGGIPFAVATIGNTENNFTLGTGYGLMWNEGEFEHTHYPITTINGMARISRRIQLVTENWIIPFKREIIEDIYNEQGDLIESRATGQVHDKLYMALSLGMRIRVGERSTVDFAPVYLLGDEGVVVPYLDFVYMF